MNRIVATLAAAVALVAAALVAPPAIAADQIQSIAQISGRVVHLGLNKSMVIDLNDEVRDVLVSNPGIADAVVRSNRRVFLMGMGAGETNVFLFGDGGRQLAQFELIVSRDVLGLQQMFAEVIPGSNIVAKSIADSLVLTGTAPSAEMAARATDLAAKFVGSPDKVVNMLSVSGTDQVHLKVVVAEVQREVLKELGVDTQNLLQSTGVALSLVGGKSLPGDWGGSLNAGTSFSSSLSGIIKLLNERTAIRTLAEPTLTAISGEQANFLAGGEYPVPVAGDDDEIKLEFKKFGIQLAFRPVVMSPGRISLQIMTEVSELSDVGAVEYGGLKIPALSVRRAESTVELPSGGSIVMAGLIRDNIRQEVTGYPGLMDVPVLGALFKSREFQRNQTELAVFVSPYLVDPMSAGEVTRPDQNLNFVGDSQAIFLNKVNKVYSAGGKTAQGAYQGRVGFAFE
jgi:pilus assembly protein CpaC